jgi:hypothetical protein
LQTNSGCGVWAITPLLTAIERRGSRSRVAERLERERTEDIQARLLTAAELGRLEREGTQVEKSLLVLSTDVAAAKRERDGLLRPVHEKDCAPGPPAPAPIEKTIEFDRWRDEVRRAREEATQAREKDAPRRDREKDKDRDGPDYER